MAVAQNIIMKVKLNTLYGPASNWGIISTRTAQRYDQMNDSSSLAKLGLLALSSRVLSELNP